MSEVERQAWFIEFRLECIDEHEAERIFDMFQAALVEIKHTHWSSKMGRDLKMEMALKSFRDNKADILASLPKEIVDHYYPENKEERHLSVVPEPEEE
jgi:hypothetical protein|tara:strand:- start:1019 stop:1312 length:294 start_codon:yes stop_codon:yes gene_type:complete